MHELTIYDAGVLMDALHDDEAAREAAREHEGLAVMVVDGQVLLVDTTLRVVTKEDFSVVLTEDGRIMVAHVETSTQVKWPIAGRRAALTDWKPGKTNGIKRERDVVTVFGVVVGERVVAQPRTPPAKIGAAAAPAPPFGSDVAMLRDLQAAVMSANVRVERGEDLDFGRALEGVLGDRLQQREGGPVSGKALLDWNWRRTDAAKAKRTCARGHDARPAIATGR